MIHSEIIHHRTTAHEMLRRVGIILTDPEAQAIEIADFGLGDYQTTGLAIVTYVNNEQYCAKELILLPYQTCPQHKHPPIPALNYAGKRETFRCRWGTVYLYVEGDPTLSPKGAPPSHRHQTYTVWHEVVLQPGQQYTIDPQVWHWFQAGADGAVVSEFSTRSVDEADIFLDADIRRVPDSDVR